MEPPLRDHTNERPPLLESPLDTLILNINVLISTPNERPPLLKSHFSGAKEVAAQERFHCTCGILMPFIIHLNKCNKNSDNFE